MALKGEAKADYMREWMRKRRLNPVFRAEERERIKSSARRRRRDKGIRERTLTNRPQNEKCRVVGCGFSETLDTHHEGLDREEYLLCPNHHALITRGIKTLVELQTKGEDVRPTKTDLESKLAKVGLKVGKDGKLDATGLTMKPLESSLSAVVPRYNPRIHKQGDTVRMPGGEIVQVPELDAGGQPIVEAW